ncbi:MAG: glycerate kinase [SAR324 cluster bacterium]|nr:glycerate kinase [SAR324 cluster bacterium]
MEKPVSFLKSLFESSLLSAKPSFCVPPLLPEPVKGRNVVLGAGKASAAMAHALEEHWNGYLEGLVVTRYGHTVQCRRIEITEAGHPVPDMAGMEASKRMLELAGSLGEDDQAICLISGGGSALLSLPAEGISLEDKQAVTGSLLRCGATIHQINTVRKHLSAIKGGRLAESCAPAALITLAISDVPRDDPAVIASGPTVPDPSTFGDALIVLRRFGITEPSSVIRHLEEAQNETPKPGGNIWKNSCYLLAATPQKILESAEKEASGQGLNVIILGDSLEGESRESARIHCGVARQIQRHGQPVRPPALILSGGETSVTLKGSGKGGPNTEFILSMLCELRGQPGIHAIACDTDGIDGSEDNAGAWISPESFSKAEMLKLDPCEYLENNDSHGFFSRLDSLVVCGPTLTNVNDFRAILIESL